MARAGTYQVEGVKELRAALTRLGVDVADFKEINQKVGDYVGALAASRAPRRSGMLAASWRPGAAKTEASVRFGSNAIPYGPAVHWGTGPRPGRRGPHNIPRNPFAWAAARETEPTWLDWYLEELNTLTRKAMEAAS